MAEAIDKFESVDILVNCAAAYERGTLLEIKAETFEKVIEIAERELKIDIRKKSGTKRSTK